MQQIKTMFYSECYECRARILVGDMVYVQYVDMSTGRNITALEAYELPATKFACYQLCTKCYEQK